MNTNTNILVIMTDQHSKHVLGCYGNGVVRTPNLDRLAEQGMVLDNAYCPAPLCVPSRMSFMTGRWPSHTRVWNNNHILGSGAATWAHSLAVAGFETALIGRMHFRGPDQRHGFSRRPVAEQGASYPGVPPSGGPMWTRFPSSTSGQERASVEIAGTGRTHYQWFDEERTRVALEYLEEKAAPGSEPFAAVLGYTLPHCPFVAPKELFDYYYSRVDIPAAEEDQPETVRRFRRVRGILDPPLPEERIRIARAAYFALCEHIDMLIGRVLQKLENTGLADRTLVVYCSDHGELAGEHGCWWKSTYYEGGAGIPMIARLPGVISAGERSSAVCNLADIGPTLTDLVGAPPVPACDGRSLVPVLTAPAGSGAPVDWPDETFSELVDHRGGVPLPSRMVRRGPWKLWAYGDAEGLPPTLFNLDDDPHELEDRGKDPGCAPVREALLARLYDGWEPERAAAASREQWDDFALISEWARATDQAPVDEMVVPPASYEDDVELL
jgi:choline-sulfatase